MKRSKLHFLTRAHQIRVQHTKAHRIWEIFLTDKCQVQVKEHSDTSVEQQRGSGTEILKLESFPQIIEFSIQLRGRLHHIRTLYHSLYFEGRGLSKTQTVQFSFRDTEFLVKRLWNNIWHEWNVWRVVDRPGWVSRVTSSFSLFINSVARLLTVY